MEVIRDKPSPRTIVLSSSLDIHECAYPDANKVLIGCFELVGYGCERA